MRGHAQRLYLIPDEATMTATNLKVGWLGHNHAISLYFLGNSGTANAEGFFVGNGRYPQIPRQTSPPPSRNAFTAANIAAKLAFIS